MTQNVFMKKQQNSTVVVDRGPIRISSIYIPLLQYPLFNSPSLVDKRTNITMTRQNEYHKQIKKDKTVSDVLCVELCHSKNILKDSEL